MLIAQCRNKLWRTEQGKIIKVEIIITKEGEVETGVDEVDQTRSPEKYRHYQEFVGFFFNDTIVPLLRSAFEIETA